MCRIIHKPWSAKHALSPEIARAHYFKTRHPRPKSLAPTIVQNTPSSPEIAPAQRSKVTLLYSTLSTQTQAKKPIGKGRTVTPPHISNKCVCKTWFHSPPNFPRPPPFIPRGRQITFSPGSSLLPSRKTSAPPPWRPHRTNFTAALLPNAGDAVHLSSCTGSCASYSLLLMPPR